jgi:hypothetical protein
LGQPANQTTCHLSPRSPQAALIASSLGWALPTAIATLEYSPRASVAAWLLSGAVAALALHDFYQAMTRSPGSIPRRTQSEWYEVLAKHLASGGKEPTGLR